MKSQSSKIAMMLGILMLWSPTEADAFWWLLARGAVGRTAATTGARAAVGEAAATEATAARAGASTATGAPRWTTGANGLDNLGTRYCVRRINSRGVCDWHVEERASDAVRRAVGPNFNVRATDRTSIFEVIDAVGNVIDIVQAIDALDDPSVANDVQFQASNPEENANRSEWWITNSEKQAPRENPNGPRIPPPPQQADERSLHDQGATPSNQWSLRANRVAMLVWSNGPIVVWADRGRRVELAAGEQIRFLQAGTIFAEGLTSEATQLFHMVDLSSAASPQSAPQRRVQNSSTFPYGSNVSCPQVPIGNGMARCQ